jgi:hypothetical protein
MELAVFQEFSNPRILEAVRALPLTVDVATTACTLAKTEGELDVVRTNAKLLFPASTAPDVVDAEVKKLVALGFEVLHRQPVTSAGCPIRDRVILKFPVAAEAADASATA